MSNITQHIIDKCGGEPKILAKFAKVHISRVYRWRSPKKKGGTGGSIPSKKQPLILKNARANGIDLMPDDFFINGGRP